MTRRGDADIVYADVITIGGLHRAVCGNVRLVNDEIWNVRGCKSRKGKEGQPLESQHDSSQQLRLVGAANPVKRVRLFILAEVPSPKCVVGLVAYMDGR